MARVLPCWAMTGLSCDYILDTIRLEAFEADAWAGWIEESAPHAFVGEVDFEGEPLDADFGDGEEIEFEFGGGEQVAGLADGEGGGAFGVAEGDAAGAVG